MSIIDKELKSVWDGLRGSHPHNRNFLEQINIRNMRGIQNLRVPFGYPVTVLAGENACGKSTVLFGAATAYKIPDSTAKTNAPSTLFPGFQGNGADNMEGIELEYAYINNGNRMHMKWRRGKAWNKSFLGRKGATQPERHVYLRTLANLTNPSEVRNMLQIKRRSPSIKKIPPELLLLSRRVLTFGYQSVSKIEKSTGTGNLLMAELDDQKGKYTEFHMAAGERSILRLSMEVSQLEDALVLIDEVEAGLHPYIQQLLMLNLQQMALRQKLQVIVTTHSPTILESVPLEGQIFLSRDQRSHDVHVLEIRKDLVQKAMYGQTRDKLSILCEDKISEAVIRGVVDALSIKMNFYPEHINIGKNTGKNEFPNHARTLQKFGLLADFIFVLDGDSQDMEERMKSVSENSKVLFLPENSCPEEWVWNEIRQHAGDYEKFLPIPNLPNELRQIEQEMSGTLAHPSADMYKGYLQYLSERSQQNSAEIARKVARKCVEDGTGIIMDFATRLQDEIHNWRTTA